MNNFCLDCGKPLDLGTKFCMNCGTVTALPTPKLPDSDCVAAFENRTSTVAPLDRRTVASPGRKLLVLGGIIMIFLLMVGAVIAIRASAGGFLSMDSAVNTVRNGVLVEYNTTTVEKAFEGTFQNPQWSSLVTNKGVTVVQFDGTIPFNVLHDASNGMNVFKAASKECLTSVGLNPSVQPDLWQLLQTHALEKASTCMNAVPIPVQVQFSLSADKKTFNITYMNLLTVYNAFNTLPSALSLIYK